MKTRLATLLSTFALLGALGCGPAARSANPNPTPAAGPSSVTDAYLELWRDSRSRDPSWRAGH